MQQEGLCINEDLNGFSCCNGLSGLRLQYPILERKFGGCRVHIGGFDDYRIAIAQWSSVVALHRNDRNSEAVVEAIEIGDSVFASKGFPPILEVAQVVPVPHNAEWICFIKSDGDLCLMR